MKIAYSHDFNKKIKKVSSKISDKFKERIKWFEQNKFHPLLNNHKLHGKYAGCRSIDITGDFRAVFEDITEDKVIFYDIGTHPELYE